MNANFINVSIFVFADEYRNLITIGELARYLNGDIFYYSD